MTLWPPWSTGRTSRDWCHGRSSSWWEEATHWQLVVRYDASDYLLKVRRASRSKVQMVRFLNVQITHTANLWLSVYTTPMWTTRGQKCRISSRHDCSSHVFFFFVCVCVCVRMQVSGLSVWIGRQLEPMSGLPPWAVTLLACLLVSAVTEFASNPATLTVFLPILSALVRHTLPHMLTARGVKEELLSVLAKLVLTSYWGDRQQPSHLTLHSPQIVPFPGVRKLFFSFWCFHELLGNMDAGQKSVQSI